MTLKFTIIVSSWFFMFVGLGCGQTLKAFQYQRTIGKATRDSHTLSFLRSFWGQSCSQTIMGLARWAKEASKLTFSILCLGDPF